VPLSLVPCQTAFLRIEGTVGSECEFARGVGGVREGSGDVVLVPADALVYDRVFEAALVLVEAG